ncbi:HNH endonuclease [Salmonella enterica]|uniref:HNH endonuclease n=3 Tax=Enterobacterales TaxID=91347 RepID=A0A607TMJ9_SALER|nr:HNH endonuclease [Salmonella enterica subsp. enterica serovar Newport]EAM1705502.1 HNH endonuclease [Salmonella enterica]ECF6076434.1 HNH endonuclease [Salmonella enterica subsp. houtenae]ECG4754089.1 HNH endonuclease [Salmonella enterica subsp. enterica serovar Richmond]EDT7172477.1 HNH endonuclease [Salmonella enterica subsp. enterica serovar Javiana]EDW1473241.1 HNH endonuclease [Salmonella enterica subsp. enterica]
MTQRYTPEQAERMKKRRYWFYVDGQRFSSAKAVNDYLGESLCHAAWRADLIAASGGENMQIGDRTVPVKRGGHTIVLERREDLIDKSVRDYNAARKKLLSVGWSAEEIDNLGNGQLYSEYKAELARQRLDIPHFEKQEIKYTRVKIRPAQGVFRARVMTNWDNRCAITGIGLALEAAHIISHASGGTPTVENGLCLAADLHTLMDRGHLLIDGNVVRLSDEAKEEPRYSGLDGTVLRKPRQPVVFPDSQ